MMHHWRKTITLTAIAAIAFANCFAPRFAHAFSPIEATIVHIVPDGHNHHAISSLGHDVGEAEDQGDDTGTSKYCCAAACSASAFILSPYEWLDAPVGSQVSAVFIEFFRSVGRSAIDPPPRTV